MVDSVQLLESIIQTGAACLPRPFLPPTILLRTFHL
jgi:hypothetical protein